MTSTPVTLRLFGSFALSVGQASVKLATRKAELLLAYLVLAHPRPVSRNRLLTVLWPEADEARARSNLSTTLWRIQKALAESSVRVVSRRGWLSVDTDGLSADVMEFRELVERKSLDPSRRLADLERAVALYNGDLLDDVDEEWCEADRTHLRLGYLGILKELLLLYKGLALYDKAIQLGRRIVALDPLDEGAHRELILLYHLIGDRSAALAQYRTINNTLQSELGISPEEQTLQLWRYIRSRSSDARDRVTHVPVGTGNPISGCPLVGREEELGVVLDGLDGALHGRGSLLILLGEAGIGKTRLIETAEVEARLRGFEILKGRCADLHPPAPYQGFVEALWPRISRKMQSGSPQVLSDFFAHLSPAMRRRRKIVRIGGFAASVVNESLLSLLDDDTPTFLVLENFQHADHATRTLVQLLCSRLAGRRVLVLLSVRTTFKAEEESTLKSLSSFAVKVQLGPLARQQADELTRLFLGSRAISAPVLAGVWSMTAGNPLAIMEYLRFAVERQRLVRDENGSWRWANPDGLTLRLPPRVQALVRERIGALGKDARAVLVLAAILGVEGDLQFLERLSRLGARRSADAIDQLFASGLLKETARGYQFVHESFQIAAISTIPVRSRRALHGNIAELMEQLWPSRSEDLAWHFAEAGMSNKALQYAELSGDKAKSVCAHENAHKWYSRALEIATQIGGVRDGMQLKIALLLKRQEILELLGRCADQIRDLEEIFDYAAKLNDQMLLAHCYCLRARSLGRLNRNIEALRAASVARRLYGSAGDLRGQARAFEISAEIYTNLRDARGVGFAYQRALSLFRAARDHRGTARAASGMGALLLFTGRSKAGLAYVERAESVLAGSPDRKDYAPILIQKGIFWRCLGHADKSEQVLVRGVEIMRARGDRVGEARGLSQLAYTHTITGSLRSAFHEARRSIRLAAEAGDTRGSIVFRNNAAYAVYRCLGEYARAERCVREALALVERTERKENQAIYYDTMAAILSDKGDHHAAYHWAKEGRKLYKRWSGQFDYVGAEIDYHLGSSALALGRLDEARECLSQAVAHWERSHDRALLAQGVSRLGLVELAQGNRAEAARLADRAGKIVRRTRWVEQIQEVYWAQAQIYRACGQPKLAAKAIKRAYAIVMDHASSLKGRLRRSYLSTPGNKRIQEEAQGVGGLPSKASATLLRSRAQGTEGVITRREHLIRLLQNGRVRRRDLALSLGISERTVGNDLAALRNFGLLPSPRRTAVSRKHVSEGG